jgi:SAM-dependent methyltransferase
MNAEAGKEIEELGLAGKYDELRRILETADYFEGPICERLHLQRLSDFEMEPSRRSALPPPAGPVDLLIALFLAGEYVNRADVDAFLGPGAAELFAEMGLLTEAEGNRCCATVALYPVDGLFIASSRWSNPDGSAFETPPDTVYPALVRNTRLFLDLLPDTPCDSLLDLGSGTGIAAFEASRCGATHAWAADIAERSTRFAEFNRRLNALPHVTTVTSDLYERFEGQTFDRIVSHPPYMPVRSPKWVFMSGGEDGEQVTRRIVEGLPRHLRDGGLCFCLTMGSDRRDRPLEQRIREWLGECQSQFDVAVIVRKVMEPEQYALRATPHEPRTRTEAKAWLDLFARLEVVSLVYGLVLVQRRNGAGKTFTVRRQAAAEFHRADWQWLVTWETAAVDERLVPAVLDSRLHASRRTEFEVLHRLTGEGWTPKSYRLNIDRPFSMNCQAEPWAAHLLSQCDGVLTGRRHFQRLKEDGVIPPEASEAEFAGAASALISGGFLEVEGFRPPQAAE